MGLQRWLARGAVLAAVLAVAVALARAGLQHHIRGLVALHTPPDGWEQRWPGTMALHNVSNRPVPPFVLTKKVRELTDGRFEHRASDVWVTSYPSSGNTWTIGMVGVLTGHTITGLTEWAQGLYCPWPERGYGPPTKSLADLKAMPSPRCFKSHWDYSDFMAAPDRGRVIFVMRAVQDTVVSSYNHHVSYKELFKFGDKSFEDFFEIFAAGDVGSGNYFQYLASWWRRRNDPNVLMLRYEEMVGDTPGHIRKIAAFIGVELSEERLKEVQEATSLEALNRHQKASIIVRLAELLRLNSVTRIRKGAVGAGASILSASQRAEFERQYNETLLPLGVPREWALGWP